MRKMSLFKTVVLTAVVVIVGYVGYYVYIDIVYSYDTDLLHQVPCPYLFSDTGRAGIESEPIAGNYRGTDTIYTCIYKSHDQRQYFIRIWKIPALKHTDPATVKFNQDVSLSNVQLYPAERLYDNFRIIAKFGTFFRSRISVDLGEDSKLVRPFSGPNYKGFYGHVHELAFENGHGQILAMSINKDRVLPTLLVLYKGHEDFYIINIRSYKPFGFGMLKILNLK